MSVKELTFSDDDSSEGVEAKEISINQVKSVKYQHDSWVNNELDPIRLPIVCRIPQDILITMRTIEKLMVSSGMGSLEFGVYLKGALNTDGVLVLETDTYVPQQRVSGATIDFNEEPLNGFNGVIHRHPNGCKNFSGTDFSYINKNFDFSLLYVDNEITHGIINVKVGSIRLQLPIQSSIMYPVFSGYEDAIEKIHPIKYSSTSSQSIGDDFIQKRDLAGYLPGLSVEPDILTEKMYQCKHCGETQEIEEFPHDCDGCDKELDQTDVTFIDDLGEDEEESTCKPFE